MMHGTINIKYKENIFFSETSCSFPSAEFERVDRSRNQSGPGCKFCNFSAVQGVALLYLTILLRVCFQGDSGGPLVYVEHGVHTQVGIVSFGSTAGCQLGYPVGFTRVTSYLNWIQSVTGISVY